MTASPPSPTANWSYPTAIRFGAGRIEELPDACAAAGITRPLLVTDRGLAALPITASALTLLEGAGLGRAMFSEVDPNPHDGNLAAGVAAYREGRHDGVVAFGGGSGLDLGKLIAFMAGQTRPVWDFEDIGVCRPCPDNTYTMVYGATSCKPCPEGGECDAGILLGAQPGFWRTSTQSETVWSSSSLLFFSFALNAGCP